MKNTYDELRQAQQDFDKVANEFWQLTKDNNVEMVRGDVMELQKRLDSHAAKVESLKQILKTQDGIDPEKRYSQTPILGDKEMYGIDSSDVRTYLQTGLQTRDMTSGFTGGGDSGGYLIPQSWENQIIERERELFVMRQLADVQLSESDRNIPVADDLGQSTWIKEGQAYPESGAEFDTKFLHAYKVGRICKVSEELLMDNSFNLENWLVETFAYTNGYAMETAFFTGDGNDQPSGFIHDAETVDAGGAILSYNVLLEMYAALKEPYYFNSTWLMNRNTLIEIMKLKDDAGSYIFKPYDTKKESDPLGHILGRPVVVTSFMPNIGAGNKPIAFGDFRRYRIHDRAGFQLQRLNELYAENGFIGFRGMQRTDGKLLIPEAIQVLEF